MQFKAKLSRGLCYKHHTAATILDQHCYNRMHVSVFYSQMKRLFEI